MRAAEWKRLAQTVLDSGWRFARSLAYRVPLGWVLHWLLPEDSAANPPGFYLWIVRMPLLVPTDVIDLSWSDRFGNSSRVFEPEAPATQEALAQAAEQVTDHATAESVVLEPPGGADNVLMQETRAYGLLLEGNVGGAVEVLGRVLRYEPRYPWEEDLARRAREMRALVEDGRTSDAVRQLEAWRSESMSALGVMPE